MRIALFTDTYDPQINGVANTVKNSARAMAEMGHDVRVYALSVTNENELTNKTNGLFTIKILPSFSIPFYPGERLSIPFGFSYKDLREFDPDIVHIHTPFAVGWEGVMGAKFLGVPSVGTHHTFFDHYLKHVYLDYKWAKKLSWDYTAMFYNKPHSTISPTRSLRDELVSYGLKKPVHVLSNSINFQVFGGGNSTPSMETIKKTKEKYGIAGKSFVYMGRVSYEKSIDEIVLALEKVVKKMPEATLMIVGDGPEKEKLQKLARNLNIEKNVVFTGFLNGRALVEALASNDFFVTASKSENMPLAVLEAEAVGLPVLAISSLGMSEIVEDNGNGFLLPHESKEKTISRLAETILKILEDDSLRQRFSQRSKELALQYSEKEITKKLLRIYEDIIESSKK